MSQTVFILRSISTLSYGQCHAGVIYVPDFFYLLAQTDISDC